jgi:hypothetical protein
MTSRLPLGHAMGAAIVIGLFVVSDAVHVIVAD